MDEIKQLLERQASAQRLLRELPWPEKLRLSEKLRDSIIKLRKSATRPAKSSRRKSADELSG